MRTIFLALKARRNPSQGQSPLETRPSPPAKLAVGPVELRLTRERFPLALAMIVVYHPVCG